MTDRVLEHIGKLLAADTIEETWSLHCAAMAEFGFDRLLYGFTRFRSHRDLGQPDDLMVLSNHTPAYLEAFIHGGLYQNAPMVRWAAENVGVCSWGWLKENQASFTDEERRIIALNIDHGIKAGYTISFPEVSRRNKGAIGLVAPIGTPQHEVEDIWARDGSAIRMLNEIFHLKATSLPYTSVSLLTARQREVLEWVGDGKTTQDIAAILGVSTATIEKHLRLAREALNVGTTAQAVLTATYKNQIFIASRPGQAARTVMRE